MSTFSTTSCDDLTIILPGPSVYGSRLGLKASRLKCRSQASALEKPECLIRKGRNVPWLVISTMTVVTLSFVAIPIAVRNIPKQDIIVKQTVMQPKKAAEPFFGPTTQERFVQTCSAQTAQGTAINFVATPSEAADKAHKDMKLTFLLHISGNFEDSDFT